MDPRFTIRVFLFSMCLSAGFVSLPAVFARPQEVITDTVRWDLASVERRMLEHNSSLAAARATIEEHRAIVRQASLWDNPTVSIEQNIYNPETGKYFPVNRNGQTGFQIQQPFLLAGKRGKRIDIESTNLELAQMSYDDGLRTLENELRTSFYGLYYAQRLLAVYDGELPKMRSTVELFQRQYNRGNVSQKEFIRLKAALLSLENARKQFSFRMIDAVHDIALFAGDSTRATIIAVADTAALSALDLSRLSLPALIDTALALRPDLRALRATVRAEEQNLSLQRALAVPDLKVGLMYDRNGSYIPEYKALTLEFDLPLFNRNQGAIEAAEYRVQSAQKQLEQATLSIIRDVQAAFLEAEENDRLYRSFDAQFAADFDSLVAGAVTHYEKGNMSLLEFTDFFETYRNTMTDYFTVSADRIASFERLNFATGTRVIGE